MFPIDLQELISCIHSPASYTSPADTLQGDGLVNKKVRIYDFAWDWDNIIYFHDLVLYVFL